MIRHYHGHLSAVYDLALHPTLDVLVSCGRDSTARVWDMRSKVEIVAFESFSLVSNLSNSGEHPHAGRPHKHGVERALPGNRPSDNHCQQ